MTYDESGIPMTDSEILADYRLYVQYMAAIMSERLGGHNADEWLDDEATDRKIIGGVRMLRENPQLVADVLKQDTTNPQAPSLARGALYTADEMIERRCCNGCVFLEGRGPWLGRAV